MSPRPGWPEAQPPPPATQPKPNELNLVGRRLTAGEIARARELFDK